MIRKPIITVLGHVDAGKTRLLDSIRGSAIAEREAGGITQHIGATEVPIAVIKKISGPLLEKYGFKISIPGLLFIDTPGHEAFTNLRKRGGSIADLAVLVVDVMKGCQNQTYEAIEILKSYKTPFIVAANKIDFIQGWHTVPGAVTDNLGKQPENVKQLLDQKIYELLGQLHAKGFQSERFDRIKDFTKEIPIIPTAAKFGEGIPEILLFLAGLSQKYLETELSIQVEGPGKGTVLEVKEEKGLGTTIDVILYDGTIKVGDELVVAGKNGIIRTKIRALLEPKPLDEMRDPQEKFKNIKEASAAAGVKVAAPNLDDALAGSPARVISTGNEEKEVMEEIQHVRIESDAVGPIVRSDTLGSLEALVNLLQGKGMKVKKADVGKVTRRDVIEADAVKEKDREKGVIFSFHTKLNDEAREEAEKRGVKFFENDIVYKLLEEYDEWINGLRDEEKKKKLASAVLPVKFRLLPNNIFRNSKPAIVGVRILAGRLRAGIEIMNKGKIIGKVDAIQKQGKTVNEAKEGEEVAISINGATVGRNLEEGDELYSFIPEKKLKELSLMEDALNASEIDLLDELKKIRLVKEKKTIKAKV